MSRTGESWSSRASVFASSVEGELRQQYCWDEEEWYALFCMTILGPSCMSMLLGNEQRQR